MNSGNIPQSELLFAKGQEDTGVKIPPEICSQLARTVIDGVIDTIGADVTFADLRLLQEVARAQLSGELVGVTEIANKLEMPMSTASRMIAQLSDFEPGGKGYITQTSHPKDRRRVVLKITPKGMAARQRHLEYVSNVISPLIADYLADR